MTTRIVVAFVVGALVFTFGRSAIAAPNVAIDLEAQSGCPDRGDFFGALQKRVPEAALTERAESNYAARIRLVPATGGEFEGTLELGQGPSATDPTTRTVRGASCAEVGEALALVLALAVEQREEAAKAARSEPERPPSIPPAAEPAPAAPTFRFAALTEVSERTGLTDAFAEGIAFGLELRRTGRGPLGPGVRALLGYAAEDFAVDTSTGGQRAVMRAGIMTLDGCGLRVASPAETFSADLCGRFEIGFIDGVVRPSGEAHGTAPWIMVGASLRGRVAVVGPLFLDLQGTFGALPSRNRWSLGVGGERFFEAPVVVGAAGLAVGVTIL